MDTPTLYRQAIKQTLIRYAQWRPSHGNIRLETVFDETHDRYALMQVGWDRGRRVRGNLVYITLQDGNIHLEYDGLEQGLVPDLLALGIPAQAITLAFLPDAPTAAEVQLPSNPVPIA